MALWDTFKIVLVTSLIIYMLPYMMKKNIPADKVHGSCTDAFKEVESIYVDNFVSGFDRGSSLSLFYKGQQVCDMWGGYADEKIQRPWNKDTVSVMFSTTKLMCALCLLKLYDRGYFDYAQPVSKYWPEFAQNGKESITVEQLVSHSAGLAATDSPIHFHTIDKDPDSIRIAFEQQRPNWNPGEAHGYHGLTFGLLVDQLIRKVDPKHRPLNVFFKEEIADPHDIDVQIGLPLSEHHRAAIFQGPGSFGYIRAIIDSPSFGIAMYKSSQSKFFKKAFDLKFNDNVEEFNDYVNWPEARPVPQGSTNGYGNARAVAKLLSAFTNAGKMPDGKRLVSEKAVKLFSKPLVGGEDEILSFNTTFGYGVFHFSDGSTKHRVGHPGYGGQMGAFDDNYDFSYSYITNYGNMVLDENDKRAIRIRKAIYNAIDKIKRN